MKTFEAKPGRRAGVGNVGKAASQRPRRPRIAAPVQAQELAAARRRLASFKPVCQTGMSEISPPARRSCSCGRTCRHPNRTLARAEKGARQNLPQFFPPISVILKSKCEFCGADFGGKFWGSDAREIVGENLGRRCGRPGRSPIKRHTCEPAAALPRG